jgi:SAM-dependent methyltransferase
MVLAAYVGTLTLLGDESRLRLCALLRERELSVTDLVRVTGISQSRVSTHLGKLRDAGFVRDRREGQHAFYALAVDTLPAAARTVLEDAGQLSDPTIEGDKQRLARLDAERKGGLPETFAGEMERHYSPGRTWESLAVGLAGLLELGDVLDVGSGDGAAAAFIAPYCRSLTCVDTSERMIVAAGRRFERQPHVKSLVADAHDLPLTDASFDAVVLFHTLTYAADPKCVVRECARVLRPRGRLLVLTLDRHEQREITAPYGEVHQGFSPTDVRSLLSQAQLEVVRCEVAAREPKKPHFRVVLALALKPALANRPTPSSPIKKPG